MPKRARPGGEVSNVRRVSPSRGECGSGRPWAAASAQLVSRPLILVLAGIILYAFLSARRERLGQIPEPADNPPDDTVAPAAADTRREPAAAKGEM